MEDKAKKTQMVSKGDQLKLRGELEDLQLIAKGGMAHIYRAKQPALNRYVVVKQLKDELFSNAEMLERFRREARALASVLHQNVAHVYDFVETDNQSFILMEYIDGVDLSFVLSKLGQLPFTVAASVLLGITRGVSFIHAHNLIHRDIKPANVRLTTRGGVKLMDFGIVMNLDRENLTRPGLMVGSPSYLSPEQILGDAITPKADLFLIGIVLYEMLTGTRPFKEERGQTVFQAIREASYVPLRQMRSTIPASLERIVSRCLHQDPKERYDSVKDLISELENYLGGYCSSHVDDIILQFMDHEALLTPAVTYLPIDKRKSRGGAFWPEMGAPFISVLVGLLAFSAALGFFLSNYFMTRS